MGVAGMEMGAAGSGMGVPPSAGCDTGLRPVLPAPTGQRPVSRPPPRLAQKPAKTECLRDSVRLRDSATPRLRDSATPRLRDSATPRVPRARALRARLTTQDVRLARVHGVPDVRRGCASAAGGVNGNVRAADGQGVGAPSPRVSIARG
jgi:hypothetical protein